MINRVVYYSPNDLSISMHESRIHELVLAFDAENPIADINDILEYHNIRKILSVGFFNAWSEEDKQKAADNCKRIEGVIAKFLHTNISNLPAIYGKTESCYKESLWETVEKYCLTKFDFTTMLAPILSSDEESIEEILHNKKIVDRFNIELAETLKQYPKAAEILLETYVVEHTEPHYRAFNIPTALTLQDKEDILIRYASSLNASLSYLQHMLVIKDSDQIKLSQIKRLPIIKKVAERNDAFFQQQSQAAMIRSNITVGLDKSIQECIRWGFEGTDLYTFFHPAIFDQCSDKNIIYSFASRLEYINSYGLMGNVNNHRNDTILEIVEPRCRYTYSTNFCFCQMNKMADMQIDLMNSELMKRGRSLESAIKYVYEDFFKEKYDYPSPKLYMPAATSPIREKSCLIHPVMEAMIKYHNAYATKGEINIAEIEVDYALPITDSLSVNAKNNVYIKEGCNEVYYVIRQLFSTQGELALLNINPEKHYSCFVEVIASENVSPAKLHNFQKAHFDNILNYGFATIDDQGYIRLQNEAKLRVLQLIYMHESIVYNACSKEIQDAIDDFIAQGWLTCDDYLLAPQEKDYISFYLNNARFTNGFMIRNRYEHGASLQASDEKHLANYNITLKLFISLLLKIDFDLRIKKG